MTNTSRFGTQDNVQDEYARLQSRLRDVITDIGNLKLSMKTSGTSDEQIKQLARLLDMRDDYKAKMEALESIMELDNG